MTCWRSRRSARNQFKGTIQWVKVGNIEVVAVITRESAERMKLKTGDSATAVIKSTGVMLLKD